MRVAPPAAALRRVGPRRGEGWSSWNLEGTRGWRRMRWGRCRASLLACPGAWLCCCPCDCPSSALSGCSSLRPSLLLLVAGLPPVSPCGSHCCALPSLTARPPPIPSLSPRSLLVPSLSAHSPSNPLGRGARAAAGGVTASTAERRGAKGPAEVSTAASQGTLMLSCFRLPGLVGSSRNRQRQEMDL